MSNWQWGPRKWDASVTFTVALLALFLASVASADHRDFGRPYDRVVAFGDSLMDPGNAYALTGQVATRPFEPVPSAPYLIGAFHFSSGATWVEQMARRLGVGISAGPAFKNPAIFSNYAVGGSTARDGGSPFSASTQIMQYLSNSPGVPSDRTLFVYGFGGNDVRNALEAGGDPTIIEAAVTATVNNLIALCATGARQVLIANVPNVGVTPAVRALGPEAVAGATALSAGLNGGVDAALTAIVQPICPTTTFYVLDAFTLSTAVVNYPDAFGFESTDPCLSFGVIRNAICKRPRKHFFWDAIHPTRAGHRLVAKEALKLISPP